MPTAIIVDKQLDITTKKILSIGWNFNTIIIDLVPNSSGYIVLPNSFLSVDSTNAANNYVMRDWKLFNRDDNTYKFDDVEECKVIESIVFDDIPFAYANYIIELASLSSYINIIGNTADVSVRQVLVNNARIEALKDNARSIDGNILSDTFVTSLLSRDSL